MAGPLLRRGAGQQRMRNVVRRGAKDQPRARGSHRLWLEQHVQLSHAGIGGAKRGRVPSAAQDGGIRTPLSLPDTSIITGHLHHHRRPPHRMPGPGKHLHRLDQQIPHDQPQQVADVARGPGPPGVNGSSLMPRGNGSQGGCLCAQRGRPPQAGKGTGRPELRPKISRRRDGRCPGRTAAAMGTLVEPAGTSQGAGPGGRDPGTKPGAADRAERAERPDGLWLDGDPRTGPG
jgi:hypothetical protein